MLPRFGKKEFLMVGVVVVLMAALAVVSRWSMQSADAGAPGIIDTRNAQIQEAYRMAEGR
ncbi:MAG: hypothetical protein GY794_02010 [bacterium]|nr:hypothetical protein [bacterium]